MSLHRSGRKPRVLVQPMLVRHIPTVLDIEQRSFEFPWRELDVAYQLDCRLSAALVAKYQNRIGGFIIGIRGKKALKIVNMAVHPAYRRHGVGSALLHQIQQRPWVGCRNRVTVLVRESNLPAQLFFKSQGFRAVRVHRAFRYLDCTEDAYVMSRPICFEPLRSSVELRYSAR